MSKSNCLFVETDSTANHIKISSEYIYNRKDLKERNNVKLKELKLEYYLHVAKELKWRG